MTAVDQAHAEATSVVPLNAWVVVAFLVITFLTVALAMWRKKMDERRDPWVQLARRSR